MKIIVQLTISLNILILLSGACNAQSFSGPFVGMRDSNEPVQIESNRLEVQDGQGFAIFTGNVNITQGTTVLKTNRLKVIYVSGQDGPGSAIKSLEATGKIAVRSGDQTATADRGDFDIINETLKLSGNVIISQGNNVISGCILDVDLKTNAAILLPCKKKNSSGRVKMLFETKSLPKQ